MPCIFDVKLEDRHCQYCTATICDERQPKKAETFTTNRIVMTQEEKKLSLKDLSARLLYGVRVLIRYKEGEPCYGKLTPRDIQWFIDSNIEVIKPYLRPMSSMTEDEKKEFCKIEGRIAQYFPCKYIKLIFSVDELDWLNAHHFDYRGLIEKGLALEALEGMYN